jgi:hypothetical protein
MTPLQTQANAQAHGGPRHRPYSIEEGETPVRRFTLRRTGRRPLRFYGWQLIEAAGRNPPAAIWYGINIYETRGGSIVVELSAHREGLGEPDLSHVHSFATLNEAAAWLEDYTPAADMTVGGGVLQPGAPLVVVTLQSVQLRQRLLRVEEVFRTLVSEVFQGLDVAEECDGPAVLQHEETLRAAE